MATVNLMRTADVLADRVRGRQKVVDLETLLDVSREQREVRDTSPNGGHDGERALRSWALEQERRECPDDVVRTDDVGLEAGHKVGGGELLDVAGSEEDGAVDDDCRERARVRLELGGGVLCRNEAVSSASEQEVTTAIVPEQKRPEPCRA